MVRDGRLSFTEAAKVVGCSDQTIRNWVAQADRDAGRRSDGLTTEERAELTHLRRRVKKLEQEKEILKKCRGLVRAGDALDPIGAGPSSSSTRTGPLSRL